MKQAHNWIEIIEVECPYCEHNNTEYACLGEGDELTCAKCRKKFVLGEQK